MLASASAEHPAERHRHRGMGMATDNSSSANLAGRPKAAAITLILSSRNHPRRELLDIVRGPDSRFEAEIYHLLRAEIRKIPSPEQGAAQVRMRAVW